jgi:hypothetical protein
MACLVWELGRLVGEGTRDLRAMAASITKVKQQWRSKVRGTMVVVIIASITCTYSVSVSVSLYQRMHACSPNIRKTHPPSLLHKTRLPSIAGFHSLHDHRHDWGKQQQEHAQMEKRKASCNRNRAEHTRGGSRRRIPPASKRRTFAHGIIGLAFDVVSVTPRFPDAEFPGGNNLLRGSVYRWPKGSGLGPGSARQALKVNS